MSKLQHRIGKKVLHASVRWARNTWEVISNHTDYENNRVHMLLINKLGERKTFEFPVLDVG